ncbi:MAG: ADP-forming succinate--CoA ligase subunit beta [Gammaproteobacteria bacterium]
MNLHEYQAKEILKKYDLPVPENFVIRSVEEASHVYDSQFLEKGSPTVVVKAQVHAGGRGKAGGVKLVKNKEDVQHVVRDLLHRRLVTYQTGPQGQLVNVLLLEKTCEIARELYLGAVIDRASRKVVIMASTEGGVDIEKVAQETPEKIHKIYVDPLVGVQAFHGRELGYKLLLQDATVKQFTNIVQNLYQLFVSSDLSLIEINPLVLTKQNNLLCLDAKINIDDNALFRQASLRDMRDPSQEDEKEIKAKEWDLSYIALEGNIGCMVNGAGLAMATMDIIKIYGGTPANFLDVGGTATLERVIAAFKIILSDQNVKGILVNIFGGIVRCDLIADGIIEAVKQVGITVPVVVRLEGNKAQEARAKLSASGLNIKAAESLKQAAEQIVSLVK